MPPRYAFWTILIDHKPTAFRAREHAELLPTVAQLRRTNSDVVLKWFSRGRLWDSPEQEREAQRQPKPVERRTREWRPGGAHKDPRARFQDRRESKPRPEGSAPRKPFDSAEGKPFDSAHRKPFGSAHRKPFGSPHPKSFSSGHGKPSGAGERRPSGSGSGKPLRSVYGRPPGSAPRKPFGSGHGKPPKRGPRR